MAQPIKYIFASILMLLIAAVIGGAIIFREVNALQFLVVGVLVVLLLLFLSENAWAGFCRILTISFREVMGLFYSPIAYVVLFLFMLFMGIFFAWFFVPGQPTELRNLVNLSRFSLFFIVPLMTMSVFSDEYRSGRMEMLRTSPITEFELVLGKFFGAMGFYLVLLVATFVYLALLIIYGRPDFGQVFASYIGLILLGCMFVSVGVFFSACTQNQIVAAMGGILTLGAFTLVSFWSPKLPATFTKLNIPLRSVSEYLSVGTHIQDFAKGTIETSHVFYFLGFSAFFLLLTYLLLESRKWR